MKKLLLCLLVYAPLALFAQEITEENYKKEDKALWEYFERESEKIRNEIHTHHDKKDSLMQVYDALLEDVSVKNGELALKYYSTPGGFQRLFMMRHHISKDRIRKAYDKAPARLQESYDGTSLRLFLDAQQIEEGDKYYDFAAKCLDGEEFCLSSLEGKNILLIYSSLGCMYGLIGTGISERSLCKDRQGTV